MVLHKQSNRLDHDCIYYFNLRRTQDAHLDFHQSSSDAIVLHNNTPASALDNVVTFVGEVFSVRNHRLTTLLPFLTDFNQDGGDSWRQN